MTEATTVQTSHLVPDWKSAWRWMSIWGYIFVISLPDLYQLAMEQGFFSLETVPQKFQWLVRGAGILGIYLRLVNQTAKAVLEAEAAEKAAEGKTTSNDTTK
jgi:hypothetical protein